MYNLIPKSWIDVANIKFLPAFDNAFDWHEIGEAKLFLFEI